MRERVPKIQHSASTLLTLIGSNNISLDAHIAFHQFRKRCGVMRKNRIDAFHHPCQHARVRDHCMLHTLGKARAQFTYWKCCERFRITDHQCRLRKRANDVLCQRSIRARQIHGGLATNRCVNHGKKRGWNLNTSDAAHVRRRCKSSNITNHTAAHSNHCSSAIDSISKHALTEITKRVKRLHVFRCIHGHTSNANASITERTINRCGCG